MVRSVDFEALASLLTNNTFSVSGCLHSKPAMDDYKRDKQAARVEEYLKGWKHYFEGKVKFSTLRDYYYQKYLVTSETGSIHPVALPRGADALCRIEVYEGSPYVAQVYRAKLTWDEEPLVVWQYGVGFLVGGAPVPYVVWHKHKPIRDQWFYVLTSAVDIQAHRDSSKASDDRVEESPPRRLLWELENPKIKQFGNEAVLRKAGSLAKDLRKLLTK